MGYTHYWRSNSEKLSKHANLRRAMEDMTRVVNESSVPLNVRGTGPYRIAFNGVDPDDCEDFVFPPDQDFDFCKTRAYPYDRVVTACLAVAAHRLGPVLRVSSDGEPDEWSDGIALASRVLGEDVPCPIHGDETDD